MKILKRHSYIIIILLFSYNTVKSQNDADSLNLSEIKTSLNEQIQELEDSIKVLDHLIALRKQKEFKLSSRKISLKARIKVGGRIQSEPRTGAEEIYKAGFDQLDSVMIIGYSNMYFKVCQIDGVCGYVFGSSIEKNERIRKYEKICFDRELALNSAGDDSKKMEQAEAKYYSQLSQFISVLDAEKEMKIKNDSIELIEYNLLKKKKIDIENIAVSEINSADGVSLVIKWGFFNPKKVIKYIRFYVVPYNAVGDIVRSDIGGKSNSVLEITGPIYPNKKYDYSYWENVWYNNTVQCIKLKSVEVIYMDGSSYFYVKELPKILSANFNNDCSY
ncbi:hypothetical protein LCM02_11615 [Lutimonas saemankumensis]|uniref:hypothetical protein n=1 Tax=Lutimonas saemankumensis TaxID=483016 RepID=UPI001CD5B15C|nr:hypothetical protein [Lutimonas saemankumensis]MCA0933103.1 hypothetical protein [Lutimonas saemankumensis]